MTAASHRSAGLVLSVLFLVSSLACRDQTAEDGSGTRLSTAAAVLFTADEDPVASISTQTPGAPAVSLGDPAEPPSPEATQLERLGFDQGSEDDPVRIVEFSDYGCSYCRRFHAETLPTLKKQYIETGKVLWKTVPFVIGNWANSVEASMAGECAVEQGKAERMTELLFERQSDWKGASDPAPPIALLAEEAGLDMAAYASCLEGDKYLWRVQAHTDLARQIGVRGTPTFFVIGYAPVQGALPLELFQQVIDTVLAEVGAGGS